jgi:hypothetical protein
MSIDLAVVRYGGEGAAVRSYADAKERAPGPWTEQIGFVERHHSGRLLLRGMFAGHYLDVDENDRVSQEGAGVGAVAGGLLGVLAGPPGIALGLIIGAQLGSHSDRSPEVEAEPEVLAERLREQVPASSSAIVLVAAPAVVDEMLAALGDGAADLLRRTLSDAEADQVEASFGAA